MARKSNDPIINLVDKTSKPIINLLLKTPITSVQTTLVGTFFFVFPAVILFSTGRYYLGLLAIVLLVMAAWFDFADGAIARIKNIRSPLGAWIDPAIDIIAQGLVVLGVIFGAYNSTGEERWLSVGLVALFGLLASNYIGLEYVNKFGFDSYVGLAPFKENFEKTEKKHFLDGFLRQLIMPTHILATFFYTVRYFVILGAVFNVYWLAVFCLAVILNFRWMVMFIVYVISLRPEKSQLAVVEVLKSLRK